MIRFETNTYFFSYANEEGFVPSAPPPLHPSEVFACSLLIIWNKNKLKGNTREPSEAR